MPRPPFRVRLAAWLLPKGWHVQRNRPRGSSRPVLPINPAFFGQTPAGPSLPRVTGYGAVAPPTVHAIPPARAE